MSHDHVIIIPNEIKKIPESRSPSKSTPQYSSPFSEKSHTNPPPVSNFSKFPNIFSKTLFSTLNSKQPQVERK